ncbi:MAG: hypothetical protein ACE360_10330 [Hyphomicrobiales bacterium]
MVALGSDELGELGQNAFRMVCSEEGLNVNSADRDRMGWDFRVEQPSTVLRTDVHVDLRPVPDPVMVQVKAVRGSKDTISVSLRTFERLIKLHEPAFIIIPRIGADQKVVELFGIHLVGAALEKSLKRIAEVSLKSGKLNKTDAISFSRKKWWQPIDLTAGSPLASFFEGEITAFRGNETYAARKAHELAELGYADDQRWSMEVTFQAEDPEDIFKGLLGVGDLSVVGFQGTDHRFGMTRPADIPDLSGGKLSVEPNPEQQYILRLESSKEARYREMSAQVSSLPKSGGVIRTLIKLHQLNIYLIAQTESIKVEVSIDAVKEIKQTASMWADVYATFHEFMLGQSDLTVLYPEHHEAFSLPAVSNVDVPDGQTQHMEFLRHQALVAEECMRLLGMPDEPIDIDDVIDNNRAFAQVHWFANGEIIKVSAKPLADASQAHTLESVTGKSIFIPGIIAVNQKMVAHAFLGVASFIDDGEGPRLECRRTKPLVCRRVTDRKSLDRFVNRFVEQHQPEISCNPDFSDNFFSSLSAQMEEDGLEQ